MVDLNKMKPSFHTGWKPGCGIWEDSPEAARAMDRDLWYLEAQAFKEWSKSVIPEQFTSQEDAEKHLFHFTTHYVTCNI